MSRVQVQTDIGTSIQHCTKRQDDDDKLLAPHRPVQGIIWVLAWLRRQNDLSVSAGAMFEIVGCFFGVSCLIVQENCTRQILEVTLVLVLSVSTCVVESMHDLPSSTPSPMLILSYSLERLTVIPEKHAHCTRGGGRDMYSEQVLKCDTRI